MSENQIQREIRAECAQKLAEVQISGIFLAILGCLLGEDWAEPRIEELWISTDRCLLARLTGDDGFNHFLGAEADLHGISAVAELDGATSCYVEYWTLKRVCIRNPCELGID